MQQIMGVGANFRSEVMDYSPLWSFGGAVTPDGEATHEMTSEEIEAVALGFERSAKLVIEEGLDGVELHAAHGYLIHQSLSPWGNGRSDKWGAPLAFVRSLIARTRKAIGPDKILGLRVCVDDFRDVKDGGLPSEQLIAFAGVLAAEGSLDYISHSEGSQWRHYARAIGSWRHPHGEFLPLTAELRKAVTPIPVIGVGRIVTPEMAEQALADGACDLVAMTRGHIADPDIALKIMTGRSDQIRRCVGANQGCIDRNLQGFAITCLVNPEAGREYLFGDIKPVDSPRSIVVVGGGPAGLKAAEIASKRGHRVTVIEKTASLGGRFQLAMKLDAARELSYSIEWLIDQLRRQRVKVMTSTTADRELLSELAPDAVILASGSSPLTTLPGAADDSIPMISPDQAMESSLSGKAVLVVDRQGAFDTMFAAEHLCSNGASVTIIAPRSTVGANIGPTHLVETPGKLSALGCTLMPNWDLVSVERGKVFLRNLVTGETQDGRFDIIVLGIGSRSVVDLRHDVKELGIELHTVGDASAPRTALEAFRDGHAAGLAV